MIAAAFAYQRSRFGRQLQAARELGREAVGVCVYRQRLRRSRSAGCSPGFAGGLYVHFLPINVDAVYLDLTFITLAMLVIGGATSLSGVIVRALAPVNARLGAGEDAENGIAVLGRTVDVPAGTRIVVVSALMALVLVLRPSGITGGRELSLEPLLRRFGPHAKGVAGEGVRPRLRSRGLALRGAPRPPRRRRGLRRPLRPHVDAINANGLRLTSAGDVRPAASDSDAGELQRATGIVATKAMHTEAAPIAATAHAFADGAVATVQNGVGNEEALAAHVARIDHGTTFPAGRILEPGVVQWDVKGDFDARPVRAEPGTDERDRAAGGRVHEERDADARSRTRALHSGGR